MRREHGADRALPPPPTCLLFGKGRYLGEAETGAARKQIATDVLLR